MPTQVNVEDLEIFRQFRAALLKFAQISSSSLANAEGNIARTRSWLEGEQRTYWEAQLRKRMEAVTQARDVFRQKKLYKDSSGRTPGAVEEEKALKKCMAAVAHAQERIESIKRWLPKLEKSAGMYRSGVSRLSKTLDDVPQAVHLLDRLALSLEAYVQIEAPSGAGLEGASAGAFEGSVSRGGDLTAPVVPATPEGAAVSAVQDAKTAGAAEAAGATTKIPGPPFLEKEAGHVVDGQ